MDEAIEKAVHRAIKIMHENLGEQITVDDMARTAMFSKFHFIRIFQRVTGISPGRFLSALRIQRAKQLLLVTSLSVADISHAVGYSSVGTFSARFSASVGVSPIRFRQLGGHLPGLPGKLHRPPPEPAEPKTTIRGDILARHTDEPGLIFVGLFPGRVPMSLPVACTMLTGPGEFMLENPPSGTWYVLAHAVTSENRCTTHPAFSSEQGLSVGTFGPLVIGQGHAVRSADVRLSPVRPTDPPVLVALLEDAPTGCR